MIESGCERIEEFPASADAVFALLADFGSIGEWWPGGLEKVVNRGQGVGMVREIRNTLGGVISERLEELAPNDRTLALSIVGEAPAAIEHYLARGRVVETGAHRCRLEWKSTFRVPSEEHVEPAQKFLGAGYKAMFQGLAAAASRRPRTLTDYEDVDVYPLDAKDQEELLSQQNECTFIWGTCDHWAVGVIMTYVWLDGSFWLTATSQRKRIAAIRRDPRVSVVVSSVGTRLGPARTVTAKGRATIHEEADTKARIYPRIAQALYRDDPVLAEKFARMLDSPRRLVLEVVPETYITFDSHKMMRRVDWESV
ncbi:MAG: SRPBCC family protein [Acidobacteriota bacterium]|nr:SRPBCC family protein [Acidobacteriota bacterium]